MTKTKQLVHWLEDLPVKKFTLQFLILPCICAKGKKNI